MRCTGGGWRRTAVGCNEGHGCLGPCAPPPSATHGRPQHPRRASVRLAAAPSAPNGPAPPPPPVHPTAVPSTALCSHHARLLTVERPCQCPPPLQRNMPPSPPPPPPCKRTITPLPPPPQTIVVSARVRPQVDHQDQRRKAWPTMQVPDRESRCVYSKPCSSRAVTLPHSLPGSSYGLVLPLP